MFLVRIYVMIPVFLEEPYVLHGVNVCGVIGLHSDIFQIVHDFFLFDVWIFDAEQTSHRMTGHKF